MYSMKKYLLLFLCLTLGVAYAQDTLRVRVMTYNLRFGELGIFRGTCSSHQILQA